MNFMLTPLGKLIGGGTMLLAGRGSLIQLRLFQRGSGHMSLLVLKPVTKKYSLMAASQVRQQILNMR